MSDWVQKEELQSEAERILPIYIAVDRSWSMKHDGKIDAANDLIPAIIDACVDNPIAEERSRICIIAFNEEAEVISPLTRGSDLPENIKLVGSGGTSYTKMFDLLRSRLEADYQQLKSDYAPAMRNKIQFYRPVVFLITDGEPTCESVERQRAFDQLTDPGFDRFPLISLFGVGPDVTRETLLKYVWRNPATASADKVTGEVIVSRDGVSPGDALKSFIPKMISSLVQSLTSNAPVVKPADGKSPPEINPIDPNIFVDFDLAT